VEEQEQVALVENKEVSTVAPRLMNLDSMET